MNTLHQCWHSGNYSLLSHTDMPVNGCGPLGVVIVPSFGWEDVCSYRPLRFMGQMFAAHGIPTLRFDLPGTGDSSGGAQDPGLFEAWVQSIGDAAAELRATAGVQDVAVLGIRLGALLTIVAATRGFDFQDLVLWGPSATGHAVLRELRAFSKMERQEYATANDAPPQPVPGMEVAGFLLSPETEGALEGLDLRDLSGIPRRRVLVLSRDEFVTDAALIAALNEAGCSVTVESGHGYGAMMALPDEAVPPLAASRVILKFLINGYAGEHAGGHAQSSKSEARRHSAPVLNDAKVLETICPIGPPSMSMFGILSEPNWKEPRSELGALFLNPGGVRHIGPNRMWVEAARRWADQGIASLRLDLLGIGESDGEPKLDIPSLYQDHLVDQVEGAKEVLRSRLGVRQFIAIGLCSGAFWAFHLAARNEDVRAAILLNPRLLFWDATVDRQRVLRRLFSGAHWRRIARGDMTRETFKRGVRMVLYSFRKPPVGADSRNARKASVPQSRTQVWQALERSQTRLTMVFTEGEPLLREMERAGFVPTAPGSHIRCIRIANAGHTFRPLWAQSLAHEIMDAEVNAVLCGVARGSLVKAS